VNSLGIVGWATGRRLYSVVMLSCPAESIRSEVVLPAPMEV